MAERETILAWADEVCATALTEARGGNTSMVNQIGGNTAMKMYFDNVYATKAVKRDAFAAYYPGHFQELGKLYEDYQRDLATEAAVDQVSVLAESLEALKAIVEAQALLIEELKAEKTVQAEPVKSASKKNAKTDPAPEVDAAPEADTGVASNDSEA
jgi:hypothetical protein